MRFKKSPVKGTPVSKGTEGPSPRTTECPVGPNPPGTGPRD